MIDTVIVSGGMIQKDFALDFIRKIEEERKGKKLLLLAADRGLDFFLETGLVPDIVAQLVEDWIILLETWDFWDMADKRVSM